MLLKEGIKFEREIWKDSSTSKTYSGQLTAHPKDVHRYNNQHLNIPGNREAYRLSRKTMCKDIDYCVTATVHVHEIDSEYTNQETEALCVSAKTRIIAMNVPFLRFFSLCRQKSRMEQ